MDCVGKAGQPLLKHVKAHEEVVKILDSCEIIWMRAPLNMFMIDYRIQLHINKKPLLKI